MYDIGSGKVGGSFRKQSITLRRQYENMECVACACDAGSFMLPTHPLLRLLPLFPLLREFE